MLFKQEIVVQVEHIYYNGDISHIVSSPDIPRPSVCLSVNFSHFHLLLQNHWANFNQTWHKVCLGEGDSSLFK